MNKVKRIIRNIVLRILGIRSPSLSGYEPIFKRSDSGKGYEKWLAENHKTEVNHD